MKIITEELIYPLKGFKPLVIESHRKLSYNGVEYNRRLKISRYNALLIDEIIGTSIGRQLTTNVVLDSEDIQKVCKILMIDYKPKFNTYIHIDPLMCSFKEVPNII